MKRAKKRSIKGENTDFTTQQTPSFDENSAEKTVSSTIFCDRRSAPLEAVVVYLHDVKHYTFAAIGKLLNRSAKTTYTSYARAKEKQSTEYAVELNEVQRHYAIPIPLTVFHDRVFSSLECLVVYLKETKVMTYRQIAIILNRDERNIWSVYHHALKKQKKKSAEQGGDLQ